MSRIVGNATSHVRVAQSTQQLREVVYVAEDVVISAHAAECG